MEFREITLEDKAWIDEMLKKNEYLSCEYCFGNHFIWKNTYKVQVAREKDFYVVSLLNDEGEDGRSFLYPAGGGNVKPVIEGLLDYCTNEKINFAMHSASLADTEELERLFPGKFTFDYDRDYADYIYTVQSLSTLAGKKLHGKRNHIARFKENENWAFEPITDDNIAECLQMNRLWCQKNECKNDNELMEEYCAVKRSFKYFKELNFFGGLLRLNSKVIAYTIAEALNEKTVVVHIEKAFSEIQGAYPTINREFVANMCLPKGYIYVNREEDLGIEGLRKAKLSYRPEILLEKYKVKLKVN